MQINEELKQKYCFQIKGVNEKCIFKKSDSDKYSLLSLGLFLIYCYI